MQRAELCAFSLEHYREILSKLKGVAGTVSQGRQVMLTHDIDILPEYALRMGIIEHENNIRSTYYILLHSEWYNALSPENIEIWKELHSLGHELGFHYDSRYDVELAPIAEALSTILGVNIQQISQHLIGITQAVRIPGQFTDRGAIIASGQYRYLADSGGRWRDGCVCNHLQEKLFLVCHPVWWFGNNADGGFDAAAHRAKSTVDRAKETWTQLVYEHRRS